MLMALEGEFLLNSFEFGREMVQQEALPDERFRFEVAGCGRQRFSRSSGGRQGGPSS
jgi:hypothetical protein